MALRFSSIIPPIVVHRRLPLVGAFCVLSLGLSNFCSSVSFFSKMGSAQSLPLVPLLRSKLRTQSQSRKVHNIRMETSSTTVPGKKLAESIVKERLAACVNRVPGVESIYEWKGEIQTDSEELLIIKTRESLLEALTEHVKANHEYEVPEVIALPIIGGNLQYLEWLKNSTKGSDEHT
ncbi:protein CutA, chloroplastic isoform X2 [Primulina huaijiensis]|uniref:protein CutA, chloroplastic isoform X2 n=1 Tax=Primulina huaijiensis TaxID=1492673 RepID=UPI003CC7924C